MVLTQFSREQLDAVVRMLNDSDFKQLIDYIKNEVTALALESVKHSGPEGERIKGACEGLQELRDLILFSHTVQGRYIDNEELEAINSRDTVSP